MKYKVNNLVEMYDVMVENWNSGKTLICDTYKFLSIKCHLFSDITVVVIENENGNKEEIEIPEGLLFKEFNWGINTLSELTF